MQVTLNLSASVSVPVFVQPDSEQPCLLGTNAALSLGLKFLQADGRPLLVQSARLSTPPDTAVVRLVQSSNLPGRKGRFLEALIDGPIRKGDELLFEPNTRALKELGLSCQEALLKVGVSGQVLVPLQNFRRDDVKLDGGTELGCVEPFGCDVELPSPGVGLCDCVEESNGAVELSDSGVGPVGGPFHHVGLDVLQLPLTEAGNRYVVVFLEYLTKWVEAFAIPDQCAETIAQLLVEEIFCRHGAPAYLLSDHGPNF